MIRNTRALQQVENVLTLINRGRVASISKTFTPKSSYGFQPGVTVKQIVTFSDDVPTCMLRDIATDYENSTYLKDGSLELACGQDVVWTIRLQQR